MQAWAESLVAMHNRKIGTYAICHLYLNASLSGSPYLSLPFGCVMRRFSSLLLATVLLACSSFAMARTTVVSNTQENCPGANAEAEAGSIGMDATGMDTPPAEKLAPARSKANGKAAQGLGRSNKSRWRALLPGTMR